MDRRSFLNMFAGTTGGVVATATMAEAGMLAEFMSWLKRAPAWSFPSPRYIHLSEVALWDEVTAVTIDGISAEIVLDSFFVDSLTLSKLLDKKHQVFSSGKEMRSPIWLSEAS